MRKMIDEIKEMISSGLDLGGADLSNFGESDPLFGEQGLDSIEAMELIMLLKKNMELRLKICSKAALFLKILVLCPNMWKKTGRNKGLLGAL